MLHRSFKSVKCKTALKLAVSRIKLLKNKREAQLRQLKRELARLLESGQIQTARIRVEHVVREEKTMGAYDLIEIYCELIAARLPVIDSQKNCPVDLKEAITSVIFASPRCADIPELMDVRKHLTAKYGKEFVHAAGELRPECGVGRLLVEKLSANAPDGRTKMKILSTIAEEHNIKWDPKSLEEATPTEDLLNGPSTFERTGKMQEEFHIQEAPTIHDQNHDIRVKRYNHNVRSPTSSQDSSHAGSSGIAPHSTFHPNASPSGTDAKEREFKNSHSGNEKSFTPTRQHWEMKFKDATSAAQAAADSAELASIAARAAAELSSHGKITRQDSTESDNSRVQNFGDESPIRYAGSSRQSEAPFKDIHGRGGIMQIKDPGKDIHGRGGIMQNEEARRNEYDSQSAAERQGKLSPSPYAVSHTPPLDDERRANNIQNPNVYSEINFSTVETIASEKGSLFREGSMKEQSSKYGMNPEDGEESENRSNTEEERTVKPSNDICRSHSDSSDENYNAFSDLEHQKFKNDDVINPFAARDQENFQTHTRESHSHDNAAVFDEYYSYDDDAIFNVGPEDGEQEPGFYFTSPGRNSPSEILASASTFASKASARESLEKPISSSQFSEAPEPCECFAKSAVYSQPGDSLPVTFDDSFGSSSESEDLDKSKIGEAPHSVSSPLKENVRSRQMESAHNPSHWSRESLFTEERKLVSGETPRLYSFSDDSDSMDEHFGENQAPESDASSSKILDYGVSPIGQLPPESDTFRVDVNERSHRSDALIGEKPQLSVQSPRSPSEHRVKYDPPETKFSNVERNLEDQPSIESGKGLNFGLLTGGLRNKTHKHPPYPKTPLGDSSSSANQAAEYSFMKIEPSTSSPSTKSSNNLGHLLEGVDEKFHEMPSSITPVKYSDLDSFEEELPQQIPRSSRTSLKVQATYFDLDSSDTEEEPRKPHSTSKNHGGGEFSWSTKSSPGKSSFATNGTTPSNQQTSHRQPGYSEQFISSPATKKQNFKRQTFEEQPSSKSMPKSKISHEEASESSKMASSRNVGRSNTPNARAPPYENSTPKASHVHPKLPDYDTLAAKFQSLRTNQK